VLDIVDCKDGDMNLVHRVLCEASLFNHQHLVQRMNRNNKRIKIDMPLKFLSIILFLLSKNECTNLSNNPSKPVDCTLRCFW
jgi:hypothetical protein